MPLERQLGKRCKYADSCTLFQGKGLPENMTRTLWRNVFCYRGMKGWTNCETYHTFEKENTSH